MIFLEWWKKLNAALVMRNEHVALIQQEYELTQAIMREFPLLSHDQALREAVRRVVDSRHTKLSGNSV